MNRGTEASRRMRKPALKDFLALPCGEVDIETDNPVGNYLEYLIREWAIGTGPYQGLLPGASGRAFATWLNSEWGDWTEEEYVPVQKILEGAVTEWCGGRTF